MQSSLDVLSALFCELDVYDLTSELGGKIYIGDLPDTSQEEDVSIKALVNKNKYVQNGFINLNIHVPQIRAGRPNLARFKKLVDIIIPLVEDVRKNTFFFQLVDDKGIYKDQERDGMYFYNLKLEFQTI